MLIGAARATSSWRTRCELRVPASATGRRPGGRLMPVPRKAEARRYESGVHGDGRVRDRRALPPPRPRRSPGRRPTGAAAVVVSSRNGHRSLPHRHPGDRVRAGSGRRLLERAEQFATEDLAACHRREARARSTARPVDWQKPSARSAQRLTGRRGRSRSWEACRAQASTGYQRPSPSARQPLRAGSSWAGRRRRSCTRGGSIAHGWLPRRRRNRARSRMVTRGADREKFTCAPEPSPVSLL